MPSDRKRTKPAAKITPALNRMEELRDTLINAVRQGDRVDDAGLIVRVGDAFEELIPSDPSAARRWRAQGEELARAAVRSENSQARLAAIERLSESYTMLALGAGDAAGALVQSSTGVLTIAPHGSGSSNVALARLLRRWADGGRIEPPIINILGPRGALLPCVPSVLRSQVRKPGTLPELSDAGLEPDFLAYLRENDLAELRSFAVWRAAQAVDAPNDDDAYQAALAVAYRNYEEERFRDRYCRPGDIAAPGEQHGHRLLRLPVRLTQTDFRNAGCGSQIYEGELGVPPAPELDYEELVRRYVDLLKPASRWQAEVNTVTRADVVASHVQHLGNADYPAVLHLMVVASQTAMQLRSMATLIDLYDELQRRGQALGAWLMGPDATEIRTGIMDTWRRLVGAAAAAPSGSAPAALAAGTLSKAEFARALTGLGVPNAPPPGFPAVPPIDDRIVGLDPAAFFPGPPANVRTPAEVRDEVDRLVGTYDSVWTQAAQLLGPLGLRDARNEIRLSGLEARAHIAFLVIANMLNLNVWRLGGPAPHLAAVQAVLDWLAGAAAPVTYDDVVGRLTNTPAVALFRVGSRAFQQRDFWQRVPVAGPVPEHYALSDAAYDAVSMVIDSYGAALDAVVSASGAQAAAATTTAATPTPYAVREADLPALYQRWTTLFVSLLVEIRARRQVVDESLLVLRLAPRRGRYGETPQRNVVEELTQKTTETAWPGHPTRTTEAYVLEAFPHRLFMRHTPILYVREDYRLALMPRGYGIGANLYSMSLLPQEEQTIMVKSSKDTRSKVSESTAENVFEEAGSETSNDFANEVAKENQQESNNQTDVSVSGKASASFLFGSAEVSSGYSAKDSSRDFAKNVNNVTSKLAQKLSSKRTVAVETKRIGEEEEGTRNEVSTERKVKNPNMGHTVTFHWFQMTRKFVQELWLEDAKLVYTSGKHNPVRILTNVELPAEIRQSEAARKGELDEAVGKLPVDIARRLPANAVVVIVNEPYTEVVPMSAANGFLARVFNTPRAVEINAILWRHLGYFDAAPDGLGVLAFPGNRRADPGADRFVPLDNLPDPRHLGDVNTATDEVADTVEVRLGGVLAEESFYLPNLDLRYRVHDGQAPARYVAARYDPYALPRLLSAEERVVNTNGVFCEAMVGRCTALEDYLQRHRELDLLEKRISVGRQEIEFRWNLAKDNLVEIREDADRAIVALVDGGGAQAFSERIEVERAQLAERRAIAEAELERKKMEAELAYREQQVEELKQRIALMDEPSAVRIDAPDGSTVAVNANVDIGTHRPDHRGSAGADVTIE